MRPCILIIILVSSLSVLGQKSVASLNPKHAIALKQFLSKNKQYQFLSETSFDRQSLKEVRKYFGNNLTPYYKAGDFNHDGILDFALILSKKGLPKKDPGVTSEPHKYIYHLVIAIFNGSKNGVFKNSFVETVEAPLVCFLDLTGERRKRLSFGVFATDSGFIMTPAGNGYKVVYPDEQ